MPPYCRSVNLLKRKHDARHVFGLDTNSGIADVDGCAPIGGECCIHRHPPTGSREFDGIRHDVEQDLLYQAAVGEEPQGVPAGFDAHADASLFGPRVDQLVARLNDVGDAEDRLIEPLFGGFNFGQVEKIVDDIQ